MSEVVTAICLVGGMVIVIGLSLMKKLDRIIELLSRLAEGKEKGE